MELDMKTTQIAEVDRYRVPELERLQTFKSAANALGLPYHTIQRAASKSLIPTYSLGDSKKYVRLKDILNRLEGKTA